MQHAGKKYSIYIIYIYMKNCSCMQYVWMAECMLYCTPPHPYVVVRCRTHSLHSTPLHTTPLHSTPHHIHATIYPHHATPLHSTSTPLHTHSHTHTHIRTSTVTVSAPRIQRAPILPPHSHASQHCIVRHSSPYLSICIHTCIYPLLSRALHPISRP